MAEPTPRNAAEESVATVQRAAEHVREILGRSPELGLILGSGLDRVVDALEAPARLPYSEIPGCPVATVPGHPGNLVIGKLGGREVACLVGRVHFYEGYSPAEVVFLVRLLAALGCRRLVVTNAAGGLNPTFRPGELMLIVDQINLPGLTGQNPLRGPTGKEFGPVFVDMSDAYDPELRALALDVAASLDIRLQTGIYLMVAGPSYETPAEARFLRYIGADAVGMSTAPEVTAARQLGIRVLGFSLITNVAGGLAGEVTHAEVIASSHAAAPVLARLIAGVIARLPEISVDLGTPSPGHPSGGKKNRVK